MKKVALTVGSVLILILSAVVFVLVPAFAGSSNVTGDKVFIGKYNGQKIEFKMGSPFQSAYSQIVNQYQNSGYQMNQQTMYQAFMQAFNTTVQQMAITDTVQKTGYVITNKEIDQNMLPYFSDENGEYSSEIYRTTPKETKLSMRNYIRQTLITTRFIEDMFGTEPLDLYGIKTSTKETEFYNSMAKEERAFDIASFDTSVVPDSIAQDFASGNKDLFDKLDLSVISCATQAEAKTILERINNSEITFNDAVADSAKYFSGADGKCNANYKYNLKPIITGQKDLDAVLALKKDEMSSIMQTSSGFSFFLCNTEAAPTDFATSEGLEAVKSYLKAYEMGKIETYYTDKAKDIATSTVNMDFKRACIANNTEAISVGAFPLNYSDTSLFATIPSGDFPQLQGASLSENFLRTAFSMKVGDVSEPLTLNGRVLVLHLREIHTVSDDADKAVEDLLPSKLKDMNQTVVATQIMSSPKLQNNAQTAFFTYFSGN